MTIKAEIHNMPSNYKPYVVANAVNGELWYWGSWDKECEAKRIAADIGGVCIEEVEE